MTPLTHRLRGTLLAGLCLAAAPSFAAIDWQELAFASGTQSIWGSGGAAAFGGAAYVVGNSSLGVSYDARASTGTVRSAVSGRIGAEHAGTVSWDQRSDVAVGFGFAGTTADLATDLGASISVTAHLNQNLSGIPISWHPALLDLDYHLDIDRAFTPALPQTVTGTDAFTPASVGIGLPTFGIGLAGGAGVDLDIRQAAQFQLTGLGGIVAARHRDSGEWVSRALSIGSPATQWLSFELGRAGTWDFSYLDLALANSFSTQFALDILAYVEYGVGIYCGDLGTDSDNILCTDARARAHLAGVNLFRSPTLALAFGPIDTGTAFSIDVLAAPVPEPGTLLLMLAGTGALLARRRLVQAS